MKQRNTLYASQGKILTNGEDYGKIIFIAEGILPSSYYEITEEEYRNILK